MQRVTDAYISMKLTTWRIELRDKGYVIKIC